VFSDVLAALFGDGRPGRGEVARGTRELAKMVEDCGGKVQTISGPLPDGSGFMTASFPLPKDHWMNLDGYNVPPMPFRRGTDDPERKRWEAGIKAAARYAVRCATMNGEDADFDPDALVQQMIVGMLGYFTPTGLSEDASENPPQGR